MITEAEVRAVLEGEENDLRFEEFCNRALSFATGVQIVRTARTGDLGVDGRAMQLDVLGEEPIVATSVRKDVAAKMVEDAKRIKSTHTSGSVYFCTNHRLSEPKKVGAKGKVRTELGRAFSATILTQDELADLATRFETAFTATYGDELRALRQRITEALTDRGPTTQLQIAHALSSPEGLINRDRVAELLVSEVIAGHPCTVNEISAGLQTLLHLPSPFPRSVVENALRSLGQRGVVLLRDDARWHLSDAGARERSERLAAATTDDQARKQPFLDEVSRRLGFTIDRAQQDKLWRNLMTEMSALLARLGARFVALVEAARSGGDMSEVRNLAGETVRGACRKAVAGVADRRVREEMEEALFQSLLDVPEVAQQWLEDLLAAWVAACQLGLVPEIASQFRPALQRLILGLDTDVVLSLLCEAEPDSGVLTDLLGRWGAENGRVFIAPEVIKEVAHHAYIATSEFREVFTIMRRFPYDPGLARLTARNAFVRSFWASGRAVNAGEFARYISSYAGDSASDTRNIEATLGRFVLGQRIPSPQPEATIPFRPLEGKVRRVLARVSWFSRDDARGGAKEQDKMDRDAAAMVKYATVANASPTTTSALLVISSSRRLELAVRRGAPDARVLVAQPGVLGLLMATMFAQQVRPQAVVQLLLAEGAHEPVNELRGDLMRMLARADLLRTMPAARIVSLEREVETAILDYAKASSRSRQQVRKDVLSGQDPDASLRVFSDALRKTAIGAGADQLIRTQADEIARLRRELEASRVN